MNEGQRRTDHQPHDSVGRTRARHFLGGIAPLARFEIKPEGITFRARNDRYNIVVTGNRWFDNKAGLGGLGAIDLQMHLTGEEFAAAYQTLARDFRGISPAEIGSSFPIERHIPSGQERRPFHELAARYAVPKEANWPMPAPISWKPAGSNPPLWTICTRWKRSSPTTTVPIQASFSSPDAARKGRRSDFARHTAAILISPVPWKQAHRLVHRRPSRQSGNRRCGRISHRRPELSHDPCLPWRCLGGRELCGATVPIELMWPAYDRASPS